VSQDSIDVSALLAGDRRALARAITRVESTRADHRAEAQTLIDAVLPHTGNALRIGISGPPGVGKSTFIETLGLHIVDLDHRLAVLAVDPSSSVSGGSILGDKTRMEQLNRHNAAFIRPSPGGGHLGGVARRTREAMLLCEASGHDVVIVETIGVGQSEIAVADLVDVFLLLVSPGGGDELQGIKRGVMELADLVVVNKADGDLAAAAGRTRADYANAVMLLRPRWSAWHTQAVSCSSISGTGIHEIWRLTNEFRNAVADSGELVRNRQHQAVRWLWSEIDDNLGATFRGHPRVAALLTAAEADVAAGRRAPSAAAQHLLAAFSD